MKVRASERDASLLAISQRAQPKFDKVKVRASERDVSVLTNRPAPTRSISVGCAEENLSSPEELRLVAHQSKFDDVKVKVSPPDGL